MKKSSSIETITKKVRSGEAISPEDGLCLLSKEVSLGQIGELAHFVKTRLHGNRAFFVRNLHLNVTNICASNCKFCSFRKVAGEKSAFVLSPDDARKLVLKATEVGAREVHTSNALNPELSLDYYLDIVRLIKETAPAMTIKGFTATEVNFFSNHSGLSWSDVLDALKEAGVESLPGGGAEIFNPEVRKLLGTIKIPAYQWLKIHEMAHKKGIPTNSTMLYGHFETPADIIDHLLMLRKLQEATGGFQAFIPLKFIPHNTDLPMAVSSATYDLRVIAVSRIFLHNIPHIKAYWVSLTPEIAQIALCFGADDLDGTIMKEMVIHAAGAQVQEGMAPEEMERLISDAGFQPTERTSFYSEVGGGGR